MEHLKDLRKRRSLLGFVCTVTMKVLLSLIDVVSVSACFTIAFSLIYLTILKDSAEVFVYATAKYTSRIRWLCRILSVNSLLEIGTATQSVVSEDPELDSGSEVATNQPNNQQLHSAILEPDCDDINTAHSFSDNIGVESSIEATVAIYSSGSPATPQNSLSNFDDTNFDNVDLRSDENNDKSPISVESSKEKSTPKPKTSIWGFHKDRLLNSLQRRRPPSAKAFSKSIASKIAGAFSSQEEDKEKLLPFNGSPEQMGCCPAVSHFFKARLQISSTGSSSVPYEQF